MNTQNEAAPVAAATSIGRYPLKICVEDRETNEILARVTMLDSGGAQVTIDTVTNARNWAPIAEQVRQALMDMGLDGDEVRK
jgi:hypothetical protein